MSNSLALYVPVFCRRGHWVYETANVPAFSLGNNIVDGGVTSAKMNLAGFYFREGDFYLLNGKTGEVSIPFLQQVIAEKGSNPTGNYWDNVPGNIGAMAALLLEWAQNFPKGIWIVGDNSIYDVVPQPSKKTIRNWRRKLTYR